MPVPDRRPWIGLAVALVLTVVIVGVLLLHTGLLPIPVEFDEERTVAVTDCDGERRAAVTAAVAETTPQRYVGLSRSESLAPDEGMLFVHEEMGTHRVVMRNMGFSIDVIFIDGAGRIAAIETLEAPDSAAEYYLRYDGTTATGRYVLEVNAGWAEAVGAEVGDCVTGLS